MGPPSLELTTRTAMADHNRVHDSDMKQEMTANIQPPDFSKVKQEPLEVVVTRSRNREERVLWDR